MFKIIEDIKERIGMWKKTIYCVAKIDMFEK